MEEKILWIWLSKIEIKNKIKLELIRKFKSLKNIWNANLDDFIYFNFPDLVIDKIMDLEKRKGLDKELDFLIKNNIDIINFKSKSYPKKLLEIYDFPLAIYYIGNLNVLNNMSIGIVGSRMATQYGKIVSREIAKQLSKRNINIVSGLAIGIDKYAHLGALESKNGKAIAVLGTGVNKETLYPLENTKLYERIIENGGIILSEYPINSKPLPYHFPARNRIISGLSDKIIVVEASLKSGSLITADFALEQGKDVWAVPGNILSKNSEGTNKLISEGAYLFSNINDII
ncbi:MAG: DNA-processing protein DprA [Candidatus Scatovivens sp.]